MKNNFFYQMENATLFFFLLNSFYVNIGYNYLTNASTTDSIIDIIIGSILIIFILLIVLRIRKNNNIIESINNFKLIKYPIFIFIITILCILTICTFNNLVSFINFYILKDINSFIISFSLMLTIFYLLTKDLKTITKISELCFYIYIFIFVLGMIGLIKYINFDNLKPLFITNSNIHIKSIVHFSSYFVLPIFLLLLLNIDDTKHDKKIYIIFSIISLLIVFIKLVLIIGVLGINLTNIYKLPEIIMYKKISFLNIFERVEVFLSFNQILDGLFIIIISIYLIKKILLLFIKKEKELIILTLLSSLFLFLNSIIGN